MRTLLLVVVTCALAWGLWTFLGVPDEPTPDVEPMPKTEPRTGNGRPTATTGTLVVRVRTPAGAVPPGARAGYVFGGEPRLKTVGPTGEARFTDAPLGKLTTLARAPGYAEIRQQRTVLGGIRCDVLLVLRPESPTAPR